MERELRLETGAKYPDKTVVHASFEGYEANYEDAKKTMLIAKAELERIVADKLKSS